MQIRTATKRTLALLVAVCLALAPIRPALANDTVGSALASLAQVHNLSPYYFSLAHRSWLDGEPVFSALDYYFEDPRLAEFPHQRMIGSELVAAGNPAADATETPLYLPAGNWYDFYTGTLVTSAGETFSIPLRSNETPQLPVYARDGAIVPMADGVLRVFGNAPGLFEWFGEDGVTLPGPERDYPHLRISVGEDKVALARGKGEISVTQLVWTLPQPVTTVFVDGEVAPFRQEGSTITVTIPPFEQQIIVTVKTG